ncbi:class I SAM-dependent methyltransferase [Virgibacillus sp. DJP39]|uniref:class I SAM-dependent methyltransferase n=1 Tax=Virgibacillus sp. DJP39 TaxID=3409790 RepID=UPI003BB736CC
MNEKENVKKTFGKNNNAYVTSSTHGTGSDLPLIIEWLNPTLTMVALDIATGGGHVAKQLSSHVTKVIASDLTEEMLTNTAKHLEDYENISYSIADAEKLPFEDDSFDIVTCRIAAHHFPNPAKFISEVYRVLKPGANFILIDNIAPGDPILNNFVNTLEKMRDYSHVRSLLVCEWKEHLTTYKLVVVKEKTRMKTLPYKEWINRTLDTEQKKDEVSSYILKSSSEIKDYFQVKVTNDRIQSFAIDEWMVLCRK